ncbi:MAG: transglycosylase domain-containing protein [Patescibacteria group bacterium]|nr:transglycosylase domain-containing protein [Patescibacteria group bacterium]
MKTRKKKNKRFKNLFSKLTFIFSFIILFSSAGFALYVLSIIRSLPSIDNFNTRQINQSTKLYDRTGAVLLYEIHGEEKRTLVPFEKIPSHLKLATLAAEDANFYNQPAFNWSAIIRAFINNVKARRIIQGGSTIGQQLVKSVFLSSEKTYTRKLKELILAIELESRYSKDEIFSFYLNQIPYGSNAYGVEAVSQIYFNKSVKEISLAEAATLASLTKAPSYYSPWGTHISELLERKNHILDRMTELGFITSSENKKAKEEIIRFAPPSLGKIKAPHFSLAVKDYLVNRFGENVIMNGGLKITTTLDWNLQQLAEKVISEGVKRNEEFYASKNAAMVVQDPKTGQILALVGSRNYFDAQIDGNFNVVTQGLRQPGSALKPFVYMTAFQKGFSPKTILYDVLTEFDTRQNPETSYQPRNFDNKFRGPVSMEQALAQSINVPAVKTLYLAGFDDVLKNLHVFGITTLRERWRYGLSLTLGGGEVKLIDLINAYSVLSQEGIFHEQSLVLKAEDSKNNIIDEYRDVSKRVIDPRYPKLINQVLSDADLRAPLYENSLPLTVFPDHEVALKTGTTEDYRDAWAMGYTPSLAIGVWAGNNDNSPMQKKSGSILAAVPIWSSFLKEALKKYPPETFEKPDFVPLPSKPMLNGLPDFVPVIAGKRYPQIHSLLFYVNKAEPLGSPLENPSLDSAFENWEEAVLGWARINILNFYSYNLPLPKNLDFTAINTAESESNFFSSFDSITIENTEPKTGIFTNLPVIVKANIHATKGIDKIELFFNRVLINSVVNFTNQTNYSYTYTINSLLEPQNLIEIKTRSRSGKETNSSIIIFH